MGVVTHNVIHVINLLDGSSWTVRPADRSLFGRILFMSDTELGALEHSRSLARTITRFRFADLGPPLPR
jgi:hypothetical protein